MRSQFVKRPLKLHDAAGGPMILILFGVPLLLILGVILLIVYAGKLISKARARNQEMIELQARLDSMADEEGPARSARPVLPTNAGNPTSPSGLSSESKDKDSRT